MIDPHLADDAGATLTDRTLRQFAALWLLLFSGLAGWQAVAHGQLLAAICLGAFAAGIGILGLLKPRSIRPVFLSALFLARPMGWIVSNALLGLLFFALFTPLAALFRLIKRDALQRHERPARATYWVPKVPVSDVRSYFRQS